MHKLQEFSVRSRLSHRFDHAYVDSATAMYRHTRRFIDGEKRIIFKNNSPSRETFSKHFCLEMAVIARLLYWRDFYGGNANHIAKCQSIGLIDSSLVDPYLARPKDAIDVTLRHAFEATKQKVVDSLTCVVVVNDDLLNPRGVRRNIDGDAS
jgi:hypothetical protein